MVLLHVMDLLMSLCPPQEKDRQEKKILKAEKEKKVAEVPSLSSFMLS